MDAERENRVASRVEFSNEVADVRMERISFGQYASVNMAQIDAKSEFRVAPKHEGSEEASPTLTFIIAVSGRAQVKLPPIGNLLIDPAHGFLTDFSRGQSEFIIEPGSPFQTFGGTLEIAKIEALFEASQVNQLLGNMQLQPGILQSLPVTPQMRRVVRDSLAMPLHGIPRELYLEGAVLQLFALIFQGQLDLGTKSESVDITESAVIRKVDLAGQALADGLSDPPTLLQLSEMTGLGARRLSEAFKMRYGQSLVDYLLDCRMQSAREILRTDPDRPIKQLASEVGYNHVSNFTRAFKKSFGHAPRAFAKQSSGG
ncbi:MAG TPA: helix-turn-helix domain-containing protein [Opitutales bacterium]|nr:helix-turn-helix domain-containing protein [Opitutales bacterium]